MAHTAKVNSGAVQEAATRADRHNAALASSDRCRPGVAPDCRLRLPRRRPGTCDQILISGSGSSLLSAARRRATGPSPGGFVTLVRCSPLSIIAAGDGDHDVAYL